MVCQGLVSFFASFERRLMHKKGEAATATSPTYIPLHRLQCNNLRAAGNLLHCRFRISVSGSVIAFSERFESELCTHQREGHRIASGAGEARCENM